MKSFLNLSKLLFETYAFRLLPKSVSRLLYGKYDYAFLVHPRDKEDFISHYPIVKHLPFNLVGKIASRLGPIIVSRIDGLYDIDGVPKKGLLVSILSTPERMFADKQSTLNKIILAIHIAETLGCRVIGLGALTSSISSRGKYLVARTKNIGITTGHAFTTVVIVKNLLRVVRLLEMNKQKIIISIVGAAGSIGNACTRLLIQKGFNNFILIDNKTDLLVEQINAFSKNINITYGSDAYLVKNADIIITATNAPYAVIKSSMVRPGTVILDDAQPADIDISLSTRDDVISLEAGLVRLKGVNCHFNFGLLYQDDVFGCLAESMMLSWKGWTGHYVIDNVTSQHLLEVEQALEKIGFTEAELRGFKKLYNEKDILRIKNVRKELVTQYYV